jgi:hypothetical protein
VGVVDHSGDCHDCNCKAFSNVIPAISPDFDILKTVAVFCGVGLCVSLILASYGLDLSAGFFSFPLPPFIIVGMHPRVRRNLAYGPRGRQVALNSPV